MTNMLSFRRAESGDMALVIDSWVSSYRTAHAAGMIPMPMYRSVYNVAVEFVLARPGVEVWVAFVPGEESGVDLYGWICIERDVKLPARVRQDGRWQNILRDAPGPLVHYVFVKHAYRRNGLARGLFRAAGVDLARPFLYTCKTGVVSKLISDHAPMARWMPLVARYPKNQMEEADGD